MSQIALFETPGQVLADDSRGRIDYLPACVPEADARSWFEQLLAEVDWRHERRRMYDRDVDVPRLTSHYRLPGESLPQAVAAARDVAQARAGIAFNSVGLNYYRDGRDSVAPHNDHLGELAEGAPIALLSLGSARRMTIRAKAEPRRTLQLTLEPGSLLLMSYDTQLHYDHGIPKTTQAVGARISLAFRVRPSGWDGGRYRGGEASSRGSR